MRYREQPIFALPARRKSRLILLNMSLAGRFPLLLPSWEEAKVMNVVQVIAHHQQSLVRAPQEQTLPGDPPPVTFAQLAGFTLTLVDANNQRLITELPMQSIVQQFIAGEPRQKMFDRLPVSLERSYVQNNGGTKPMILLEFVYE